MRVSGAEAVSFAPIKKLPTSASVGLSRVPVTARGIQHTVKYTATNPARFEKLWR